MDKKDDKKYNEEDDDSEEEFKKKQKVHKVPLTRNKQAFGDFGAFKTKSKPAVKLNEPIKQKSRNQELNVTDRLTKTTSKYR